jgi:hypothetical protein
MAGEFARSVKEDLIKELYKTSLWKEKLKLECKSGEVFVALRKDYVAFYYKGGRFLTFDGSDYATNIKYAPVTIAKGTEIKEKQLGEAVIVKSFLEGYDRLKESASKFADEQKKGQAILWHACSPVSKEPSVILDIEIGLKDESGKEAIDVLLYNKSKQILRFAEVKLFSNKDLWNQPNPKEPKQIQSYKEQIKANKKGILAEYGRYINSLNMVLKTKLKPPAELDDRVALTIFGFDGAQINDKKFTNALKKNPAYADIPIYCKGDATVDFLTRTIWKKTC